MPPLAIAPDTLYKKVIHLALVPCRTPIRKKSHRASSTMIQVEHLSKFFGPVLAVNDVTFAVEKGEIVGLLGNNGAGKTTIMRILTTYLPATSGIARVAGFDVMNESMEVRR